MTLQRNHFIPSGCMKKPHQNHETQNAYKKSYNIGPQPF